MVAAAKWMLNFNSLFSDFSGQTIEEIINEEHK